VIGPLPWEAGALQVSDTPREAAVTATSWVGLPGTAALGATVTAALPLRAPTDAITFPLPENAAAVNVVEAPMLVESAPRPAGPADHAAPAIATAFP
jgi:hypothetical protein